VKGTGSMGHTHVMPETEARTSIVDIAV